MSEQLYRYVGPDRPATEPVHHYNGAGQVVGTWVPVTEPLYRIDGTEPHPTSSGRFYQPKLVPVNGADDERSILDILDGADE